MLREPRVADDRSLTSVPAEWRPTDRALEALARLLLAVARRRAGEEKKEPPAALLLPQGAREGCPPAGHDQRTTP
jgi:hypothetical protein